MQEEGTVKFLKFHQGTVRGVAFSPTVSRPKPKTIFGFPSFLAVYFVLLQDRYLFCSGGYDGKVNLYTALRTELLMSYQITSMTLAKNINAVRFTIDGSKVILSHDYTNLQFKKKV